MRVRIGSTIAVIAVAVGLASSVAGPVLSAFGGSSTAAVHRAPISTNRII